MRIVHDKKSKKFVAMLNNRHIGYLKYSFPQDASAKNGNRNIQIDYIYVHPAQRKRGYASELIKHFLKFSQNMAWISLWTGKEAEIDKTFNLYKKHGFQQKVICEDYYEDGIPTRLFVKKNPK